LEGSFRVPFVYKSALLMAALTSNCSVEEQQGLPPSHHFLSEGIAISEAGDSQKVKNFATQSGSFAPR